MGSSFVPTSQDDRRCSVFCSLRQQFCRECTCTFVRPIHWSSGRAYDWRVLFPTIKVTQRGLTSPRHHPSLDHRSTVLSIHISFRFFDSILVNSSLKRFHLPSNNQVHCNPNQSSSSWLTPPQQQRRIPKTPPNKRPLTPPLSCWMLSPQHWMVTTVTFVCI